MTEPLVEQLPGDAVGPVDFSEHAIDRFVERLRPGIDAADARLELSRLVRTARVTRVPSDWAAANPEFPRLLRHERHTARWLCLGEDVVMPLHDRDGVLMAATVIFRGKVSPEVRRVRNSGKATARAGKRASRRAMRDRDRRQGPGPSAEEFE